MVRHSVDLSSGRGCFPDDFTELAEEAMDDVDIDEVGIAETGSVICLGSARASRDLVRRSFQILRVGEDV